MVNRLISIYPLNKTVYHRLPFTGRLIRLGEHRLHGMSRQPNIDANKQLYFCKEKSMGEGRHINVAYAKLVCEM